MRKTKFLFGALLAVAMASARAWASPSDEVRSLYYHLAAAQNDRDLGRVRSLLLPSPRFLWVSDGMTVWGADAVIERMSQFQTAEIWHVEPDLAKSVAVTIDERTAYLHLPLCLTIGPKNKTESFGFLVTVLAVETGQGWRIAALLTTADKSR